VKSISSSHALHAVQSGLLLSRDTVLPLKQLIVLARSEVILFIRDVTVTELRGWVVIRLLLLRVELLGSEAFRLIICHV